jgi:hypothetical protein
MARLKAYRGKLMVHKHRGNCWTVRTNQDESDQVLNWMRENFGEEDFEHGAWARILRQYSDDMPSMYDITDRNIVHLMALRWS